MLVVVDLCRSRRLPLSCPPSVRPSSVPSSPSSSSSVLSSICLSSAPSSSRYQVLAVAPLAHACFPVWSSSVRGLRLNDGADVRRGGAYVDDHRHMFGEFSESFADSLLTETSTAGGSKMDDLEKWFEDEYAACCYPREALILPDTLVRLILYVQWQTIGVIAVGPRPNKRAIRIHRPTVGHICEYCIHMK